MLCNLKSPPSFGTNTHLCTSNKLLSKYVSCSCIWEDGFTSHEYSIILHLTHALTHRSQAGENNIGFASSLKVQTCSKRQDQAMHNDFPNYNQNAAKIWQAIATFQKAAMCSPKRPNQFVFHLSFSHNPSLCHLRYIPWTLVSDSLSERFCTRTSALILIDKVNMLKTDQNIC